MTQEEQYRLCRVSMCPPEHTTDTDYIEENSPLYNGNPNHFIIEFGKDISGNNITEMLVSEGQKISCGQVIAYMDKIPVKSEISGTITEKNNEYIIGDYTNDASLFSEEDVLNLTDPRFEEINDIVEKNKNVSIFIKDYILKFRFPDFATNCVANPMLGYSTTEEVSDKYKEDARKIIKRYENKVKKICGKDNVQTHCENDDLASLKTDIDNARKTSFDEIIIQYRSTSDYRKTSGMISDYMLYDFYFNYIFNIKKNDDEDDFIYDDKNPYVVELVTLINEFLNVRSRIEMTGTNMKAMIADFNSLCMSEIGQYYNSTNYYEEISAIFRYDFFTDDDNLVEAAINDKKRVTLYSKVLDFLKTKTKYTEPRSAEDVYKNFDYDTLINSGDLGDQSTEKENNNKRLLEKLKKIAFKYVHLRKMETDPKHFGNYTKYISDDDLNNIFAIKTSLEAQLADIKDYYIGTTEPRYLAYSSALKKYLGALKSVTDDEAKKLKELTDKAIRWYEENHESIDSGKIFNKFQQISWPSPCIVKKDGISYDFFFIQNSNTIEKIQQSNNSDYVFSEDSVKTKYGIDSLGYWMRYFTIATLGNCMMMMYWATGIILPSGPLMLPIIFIPFIVIPGRVIIVIGLGVCGICPLPMIYFVNVGDIPGSMIPAINLAVDVLKKMTGKLMDNVSSTTVKESISAAIKPIDLKINAIDKRIEEIDREKYNLENGVKEDKETLRALKKQNKEDSTSNKRKKGSE